MALQGGVMRLLRSSGSKRRIITEDGHLYVQEWHAGEWWNIFEIALRVLAEAYEEWKEETQAQEG